MSSSIKICRHQCFCFSSLAARVFVNLFLRRWRPNLIFINLTIVDLTGCFVCFSAGQWDGHGEQWWWQSLNFISWTADQWMNGRKRKFYYICGRNYYDIPVFIIYCYNHKTSKVLTWKFLVIVLYFLSPSQSWFIYVLVLIFFFYFNSPFTDRCMPNFFFS